MVNKCERGVRMGEAVTMAGFAGGDGWFCRG